MQELPAYLKFTFIDAAEVIFFDENGIFDAAKTDKVMSERLEKEEKKLQGELARVNGMLNNERFLSKAPESKIAEEKEKLEKYTQMMEQVRERLAALRK